MLESAKKRKAKVVLLDLIMPALQTASRLVHQWSA